MGFHLCAVARIVTKKRGHSHCGLITTSSGLPGPFADRAAAITDDGVRTLAGNISVVPAGGDGLILPVLRRHNKASLDQKKSVSRGSDSIRNKHSSRAGRVWQRTEGISFWHYDHSHFLSDTVSRLNPAKTESGRQFF